MAGDIFFPLVLFLSTVRTVPEAILTLLLGAGPLVLAGGFASGIAKFTYWWTHHGSTKVLAGTGALLTLFGFMVTLVEPAANFAHALPNTFTYRGHSDAVTAIEWSPDGNRIASGSDDETIQVWNPVTGETSITYHQGSAVHSLAWSPDGAKIVSGGDDGTAKIWEARPDQQHHSDHPILVHHQGKDTLYSVAWSPDGTRIASGSADGTVQVWNASNGKDIFHFGDLDPSRNHSVRPVAWSPDGNYLAYGGADKRIDVLDASNGKTVNVDRAYRFGVTSLTWSPDGKYLASSGDYIEPGGVIKIWTALTGVTVLTKNVVYAQVVSWSPNGKYIASGGAGLLAQVRVWSALTGNDVAVYTGHSDSVVALAWSPDSTQIASGGVDKTVQVWNVGV